MAFTRAHAEASIVGRLRGKMALVGFATTTDGSNADLDDPIAVTLRKMGKTASSPVSDGDLSGLSDIEIDEFIDRAELRTLESIAGNIDLTDISVGPRRESLGQLATQVETAIARLQRSIQTEFGAGLTTLKAGSLTLDFQQTDDDAL
jgi:hypothetical protein